MSYEIPQALQYEEKIMFGLTFKQLACIGAPALLGLVVFKTSLPIATRVVIIILLMGFGAVCAFLNVNEQLWSAFKFYATPRSLGYLHKNMLGFMGVKTIQGNIVGLKSGEKCAILQVFPVNFAIKAEEDRDAIIRSFQKFLNALDHPVQILVRTVNLNLDQYLAYLKKKTGTKISKSSNKSLQDLFEDYCSFIQEYIDENAVKNRRFYLIIPSGKHNSKDVRAELEELDVRVRVCKENLANTGLVAKRLSTSSITSLFASFFEGYLEVDNDYLSPLTVFENYVTGGDSGA